LGKKLWSKRVNAVGILNKADFFCFGDGQGAFIDAEFAVDVFDVVEDGVKANNQLFGDLFVL